jgi:hypothetical protein
VWRLTRTTCQLQHTNCVTPHHSTDKQCQDQQIRRTYEVVLQVQVRLPRADLSDSHTTTPNNRTKFLSRKTGRKFLTLLRPQSEKLSSVLPSFSPAQTIILTATRTRTEPHNNKSNSGRLGRGIPGRVPSARLWLLLRATASRGPAETGPVQFACVGPRVDALALGGQARPSSQFQKKNGSPRGSHSQFFRASFALADNPAPLRKEAPPLGNDETLAAERILAYMMKLLGPSSSRHASNHRPVMESES